MVIEYFTSMTNKFFAVSLVIICLMALIVPSSIALDDLSAQSKENTTSVYQTDTHYISTATILGTVNAAITCRPTPLKDARVIAIRVIPAGQLFFKYQAFTDSNGEYQLQVPAGFYRVFVRIKGYQQSTPVLFHLKAVEPDHVYTCSFIVRPRILLI